MKRFMLKEIAMMIRPGFATVLILAGTGSVPFAAGAGFRKMSEAALVKNIALHRFGEDFAVEGYLRDPYAPPAVLAERG